MPAYWFRFINDNGDPTGYMGLVVGQSQDDIYLQIDEFGDPGRVEVRRVDMGGVCWKDLPIEPDEDDDCVVRSEFEVSENSPDSLRDKAWRTPKWCKSDEALQDAFLRIYGRGVPAKEIEKS